MKQLEQCLRQWSSVNISLKGHAWAECGQMKSWADLQGLIERDEFPVKGISNSLPWDSLSVLPEENQQQGPMSVFCG